MKAMKAVKGWLAMKVVSCAKMGFESLEIVRGSVGNGVEGNGGKVAWYIEVNGGN